MPAIDPATRMGAVHLTVADLDRSLDYYRTAVGVQEQGREDGIARLGTGGEDLLVLYELPGAQPAPQHTGLFHFALLVPSRPDLARWLVHAAQDRVPLSGMSDHLVSEAIYLRDPDWHGIEIYRDRPRSEWPLRNGGVAMDTLPLDTDALLGSLDGGEPDWERLPPGTTMGHVHLQVADVAATEQFYSGLLGFDIMAHLGDQATFLSAGGYHHHLGGNTWNSRGGAPPPEGAAALRHTEVILPNEGERDRVAALVADAGQEPEPQPGGGVLVRDPSHNALLLTVLPK
ncbi:MAG: VOC family protein [Thermoleophilaceae bacterium]